MLPLLPREFLWNDFQSMDDFFRLDPINEDIYEVFLTLSEEPFNIQVDAVKVFNEVYYQVTRMCFEYPLPPDFDRYIADIKANLGWNYSAELVMSIAYQIISLIDNRERPFNKFFTKAISDKYAICKYWQPFNNLFISLKKKNRGMQYTFTPCPIPIVDLSEFYLNWSEITHNFDLSCIEHVINLWDHDDDRKLAAELLLECLNSNPLPHKKTKDIIQIKRVLYTYMFDVEDDGFCVREDSVVVPNNITVLSQYDNQWDVIIRLRKQIEELETENEKLKSKIAKSNSKKHGMERVFTLGLILNYCKRKCRWEDVKEIVAMLNCLVRDDPTQEDYDLIDSIEEEYKKRTLGNVTMQNPTINGPIYGITGNDKVNIGKRNDGE